MPAKNAAMYFTDFPFGANQTAREPTTGESMMTSSMGN
jgi:hypothetical protein